MIYHGKENGKRVRDIKTYIFDLDGVICDTAKYHFIAWKTLANRLEIPFTSTDNERLKGISRMESLEILLSLSPNTYTEEEKHKFAEEKNRLYVEFITKMNKTEILPGVTELLKYCREYQIKTALGSVSKNANLILERLELKKYFDVVVCGTDVVHSKPDPEVFLKGAELAGVDPKDCVVFEDAFMGILGAKSAGMIAVGIGEEHILTNADFVIPGFQQISPQELFARINKIQEVKQCIH